jgi:hypothetical protein
MPALFPGYDLARVLSYSKYRGEGPTIRDRPARGGNLSQPDVPASNVFTTPLPGPGARTGRILYYY